MSIINSIRALIDKRAAHRLSILEYAWAIDARQFPYFCSSTGELGESLPYIIRATLSDWRAFRVIHRWHYTRNWQ